MTEIATVLGVGHMGVGIYKSWADGKTTREYQAWKNMLERCYSSRFQAKNPIYKGCSVASEWHNFQEFSQWLNCHAGWRPAAHRAPPGQRSVYKNARGVFDTLQARG